MTHAHMSLLVVLTLSVGLATAGCYSWHQKPLPPGEPLRPAPGSLRLTLADGRRMVLANASLSGDSIVGYGRRGQAIGFTGARMGEVVRLEMERFSAGRTAALAIGLAAVVGAGVLIARTLSQSRPASTHATRSTLRVLRISTRTAPEARAHAPWGRSRAFVSVAGGQRHRARSR